MSARADAIRRAIPAPPEEKHSRTCGLLGHDLCRPCAALHALALLEAERESLRNTLALMVSHLAHQDQDANHEWMAKRMRAALGGAV